MAFTPQQPTSASNDTSSKSDNVRKPGSTILTFVNAHLAAFDEMVDKRNSDFHELSKRLTFENPTLANSDADQYRGNGGERANYLDDVTAQTVGLNPPLSVYEGDVVFWMVSIELSAIQSSRIYTSPISREVSRARWYTDRP